MIVAVIIGLLAAIAVPAFTRVIKKSQVTTVVNDLRQFSSAFEQYSLEYGAWPVNTDHQVVPLGMEGQLPAAAWETPIAGGHVYDWDTNVSGVAASISLRPNNGFNAAPLFLAIDQQIDDGDITTGRFFLNGDRFMLVLEQ